LFAKRVIGWAKAHDTACVKPVTHATDTDVGGKNGKDINVSTTLPAWCKVGKWVMDLDGDIWKIGGAHVKSLNVYKPSEKIARGLHYSLCKPIRFRPYTYEEAKGLLGKTMEYTVKNAIASKYHSMLICKVSSDDNNGDTFIHSCHFSDWVDYEATIDGVPIGVPEVDEEAFREVEE
jgi:FAD/FMN-containing dehydrogenase